MAAKSAKMKTASGKSPAVKASGKAKKPPKSVRPAKTGAPRAARKKRPETKSASKTAAKRPKKASGARKTGARRPKPRPLQSRKLEEFRDRLLFQHRELLQSYTSTKGDSRSRQSDGTEDYIDYAVSSYDREFLLSLTEMEQRELMLVEDALRRLERGEFGRCMHCAKPIPPKRLEVQPWARYCVACQELEDQGLLELPDLETEEDAAERIAAGEDDEPPLGQEVEFQDELEIDEAGTDDEEQNLGL